MTRESQQLRNKKRKKKKEIEAQIHDIQMSHKNLKTSAFHWSSPK
jgi:hypothetical protein